MAPVGWMAYHTERPYPNLARSNRFFKLQPHRFFDAERVIYHDASMQLKMTGQALIRHLIRHAGRDHEVFTLRHSLNHTLADEAAWIKAKGITRPEIVDAQMERYRDIPQDLPTAENGLLVMKLTPRVKDFLDLWWHEVEHFSHRDQLSFPYAYHKTGVDLHIYQGERRKLRKLAMHVKPQLQGAV
jgi:hypothetical protein